MKRFFDQNDESSTCNEQRAVVMGSKQNELVIKTIDK
jgi:hypothetical protein